MVMQKEEESKAKFVEKKKEAKEKFAVDKVFPKRAEQNNAKKAKKGVVGLGPSTKSKKKELNADAEIEQYLKELGLD